MSSGDPEIDEMMDRMNEEAECGLRGCVALFLCGVVFWAIVITIVIKSCT